MTHKSTPSPQCSSSSMPEIIFWSVGVSFSNGRCSVWNETLCCSDRPSITRTSYTLKMFPETPVGFIRNPPSIILCHTEYKYQDILHLFFFSFFFFLSIGNRINRSFFKLEVAFSEITLIHTHMNMHNLREEMLKGERGATNGARC